MIAQIPKLRNTIYSSMPLNRSYILLNMAKVILNKQNFMKGSIIWACHISLNNYGA